MINIQTYDIFNDFFSLVNNMNARSRLDAVIVIIPAVIPRIVTWISERRRVVIRAVVVIIRVWTRQTGAIVIVSERTYRRSKPRCNPRQVRPNLVHKTLFNRRGRNCTFVAPNRVFVISRKVIYALLKSWCRKCSLKCTLLQSVQSRVQALPVISFSVHVHLDIIQIMRHLDLVVISADRRH